MGTTFWIRRALTVFALVAAVLFVVNLLKGRGAFDAVAYSATWAALSTAVFITGRLYQSRRGQACALCQDTPVEVASEG